ncbi:MAG: hypothetical protein K2H92_01145 [Bacteroidaceae bacterium]|nr:hypothetical protein [Bacteroidaceae bacterium]
MRKFLALMLLAGVLFSCQDEAVSDDGADDTFVPLCFDKEYYEKPFLERFQSIVFRGGSDDLSIEVSDAEILDAAMGNGKIYIAPKKKGVVDVVVRDDADDTSVAIKIKVIDKYLCLRLAAPVPNGSHYYKKGDRLFLVNDKNGTFYLYDDAWSLKNTGSYRLFRENAQCRLSLSFSEKDVFVYDISKSSHGLLFGIIPSYLDCSWGNGDLVGRSRSELSVTSMTAVDLDTNDAYIFYADTAEMPYGILN